VQFLNVAKQRAVNLVSENATVLLTAGGVVGTVATAVLAGRGGIKYAQILREKQETKMVEENDMTLLGDVLYNDDVSLPAIDTVEKLKIAAPYFIPPIVVGGVTITSIIMAHRMSSAKIAALAAAYGLAESQLGYYREKITEKLTGPKKQAIEDEIAQERVNKTSGHEVVIVGDGEVLCYDEPTGRYFNSTMENIKAAVNATNAEILNAEYVRATFFYEELSLPATTWTDEVGWNREHLMDLKYSTVLSPDGKPCIAINFTVLPKLDYIPKYY